MTNLPVIDGLSCSSDVYRRRIARIRLCALCVMAVWWTAVPLYAQQITAPKADTIPADVKITPGCVVTVTVDGEPELSGEQTVDSEGLLRFTMGSDGKARADWSVAVKDKTASEARQALLESFKTYLKAPVVDLILVRIAELHVQVRGAAVRVGPLALPYHAHLSDALATCVPYSNADLEHILIDRRRKVEAPNTAAPGSNLPAVAIEVNYLATSTGKGERDPALEDGDILFIPALKPVVSAAFVRVVGEVEREAGVPWVPGMTVKEALFGVGGLKSTADTGTIRLVRSADGQILALNAEKAMAGDAGNNLVLKPGDMLIVGKRDRSLKYAVLGEVKRPQTFEWSGADKVTISRAIAAVGGFTPRADKHKGLLRKGYLLNPAASRDVLFDLSRIAMHAEPDWSLEAGDAIVVLPHIHRPGFLETVGPWLLRFLPLGL